ncbi:hypothetical protein K7432_010894 [Basidiobolus ranarum]|uniref:Uncharacterized protein n=1 Tax=Basidiobolus ranarum TaxID=34480 RepID=A0ABR2VUS9_9FUNG
MTVISHSSVWASTETALDLSNCEDANCQEEYAVFKEDLPSPTDDKQDPHASPAHAPVSPIKAPTNDESHKPTEKPNKPVEPNKPTEKPNTPVEPHKPTEKPNKPTEKPKTPVEPHKPTEKPNTPVESHKPTEAHKSAELHAPTDLPSKSAESHPTADVHSKVELPKTPEPSPVSTPTRHDGVPLVKPTEAPTNTDPSTSVIPRAGEPEKKSSENHTGAIVGGVVGGAAGIALIAGFIGYRYIIKKREFSTVNFNLDSMAMSSPPPNAGFSENPRFNATRPVSPRNDPSIDIEKAASARVAAEPMPRQSDTFYRSPSPNELPMFW